MSSTLGSFHTMTNDASTFATPLDGFDLGSMTSAEQRQVAVLLLWAISRARIGHDKTTRYLSEQSDLDDYLAPFADVGETTDSAAAWAAVRASAWWASDVDRDVPLGRAEVLKINPAGGLPFHLADVARDDERCREVVRGIVELLPVGSARDDLLYDFALEQFVPESHQDVPGRPTWPGVLDANLAVGSHELANAASVGDWEAVLEILDAAGPRAATLVNTWRPGGVSMVALLHQAAIKGAPLAVTEQLIRLGTWKTLTDSRGWLPVELALLHGSTELVKVLEPRADEVKGAALMRVLNHRLGQLLGEITKEDSVPRFRTPQVPVIAEIGGEIDFDLSGSGHFFTIFLEEGELLVEHKSAGSDEGGVVYRVDSTGVVDTWEHDLDDDGEVTQDPVELAPQAAPSTRASTPPTAEKAQGTDQADEAPPTTGHEAESPAVSDPAPSLSGVRTYWSELGDCAITVVPRELIRKFNRDQKRASTVLVATVSDFKKGRRWESVTAVPQLEQISDETVAGQGWAYAVVVEVGAEKDLLKRNLRAVLEREAETGSGPESQQALLAAMANRHGRKIAQRVEKLWKQIHELAVSAAVDPQRGNAPNTNGGVPQSNVVDARERRGAGANPDASTGGEAHFDPPIRMELESSNFSARADWNGETIIVKSGSAARKATLESMPAESRAIRKNLLDRGVLRDVSGRYVFTQDCRFKSVSSAASLIAGRTAGGRVEWKDSQGQTINDILGGPKYRRRG